MMNEPLQLPDYLLKQLIEAAEAAGTTPIEWIQAHLPCSSTQSKGATREEIDEANSRLAKCIVNLGYPTGTDNEQIDADLAREYADTHEPTSFGSSKE